MALKQNKTKQLSKGVGVSVSTMIYVLAAADPVQEASYTK